RYDGPDVHRLVERVAYPHPLHAGAQLLHEPVRHVLLHEQARTGAAHLALVEPDCVHHPLDHAVEVGVVEHDEGRLAPQLKREALAAARGGLADVAAYIGRAREGDLVYAGVVDDGVAHLGGVACDDVDHAGRQTYLFANLREGEGGEGRVASGLEHHRVAHGDGGGDLPGQHEHWEVPGYDLAHDADGHHAGQLGLHELRP